MNRKLEKLNQKQIEQKYNRLINRQKKLHKELEDFRESIQNICEHSQVVEYFQDADDGYGKWWKIPVSYCKICRKRL